jgi:MYXO-CTERM domain-containing protein
MKRISIVLVVVSGTAAADPHPQDPYPDVRVPRRENPPPNVSPALWSQGPMRYPVAPGEGVVDRPRPAIVAGPARNATAASRAAAVTKTASSPRPAQAIGVRTGASISDASANAATSPSRAEASKASTDVIAEEAALEGASATTEASSSASEATTSTTATKPTTDATASNTVTVDASSKPVIAAQVEIEDSADETAYAKLAPAWGDEDDAAWPLAIPGAASALGLVLLVRRRRRSLAVAPIVAPAPAVAADLHDTEQYPLTFPAFPDVPFVDEPSTPGTWESCHELPSMTDFEIAFPYKRKDTAVGW